MADTELNIDEMITRLLEGKGLFFLEKSRQIKFKIYFLKRKIFIYYFNLSKYSTDSRKRPEMTILQLKITGQVARFKCLRAKCEHYAKNREKYFSVRNWLNFPSKMTID